jgi:hypothetical protein
MMDDARPVSQPDQTDKRLLVMSYCSGDVDDAVRHRARTPPQPDHCLAVNQRNRRAEANFRNMNKTDTLPSISKR